MNENFYENSYARFRGAMEISRAAFFGRFKPLAKRSKIPKADIDSNFIKQLEEMVLFI